MGRDPAESSIADDGGELDEWTARRCVGVFVEDVWLVRLLVGGLETKTVTKRCEHRVGDD
mgnify:FL=1